MSPRQFALLASGALLLAACAGDAKSLGSQDTAGVSPVSPTTGSVPPITIPATYTLQAGDSPSAVAERFGITVAELEAANADSADYYRFLVGAEINLIPPPTTVPPSTAVPPASIPLTTAAPITGRVTMAFTGDVLAHRAVNRAAALPDGTYDYTAMFTNLAPVVGAVDLAVCHLESPIAPDEQVGVPPPKLAVAPAIGPVQAAAGYDRCSTASNHALNGGAAGVDATIQGLAAAGLGQSGMAASADQALPPILEINGVRVVHLSYSYGFDGDRAPEGEPWRANLIDPARIISDAQAERALGAEVVVVSMHWGASKTVGATAEQRRVAQAVTASGAIDLIVGHHAHVLQPIEQVNGVWVVWGLGNLLSDHPTSSEWPASTQDGAVVTVAVQRGSDGAISVETPAVHPTWCDTEHGYVIRFTTEADDPSLSASVREQLRVSQQRTADVLGPYLAPA